MDEFAYVYLAVFAVALVGAIALFWFLSRKAPRGTVLGIAVAIYMAGVMISPGTSRVLVGAAGMLKLIGFIGGILGLIDLLRKRSDPREDLDFK